MHQQYTVSGDSNKWYGQLATIGFMVGLFVYFEERAEVKIIFILMPFIAFSLIGPFFRIKLVGVSFQLWDHRSGYWLLLALLLTISTIFLGILHPRGIFGSILFGCVFALIFNSPQKIMVTPQQSEVTTTCILISYTSIFYSLTKQYNIPKDSELTVLQEDIQNGLVYLKLNDDKENQKIYLGVNTISRYEYIHVIQQIIPNRISIEEHARDEQGEIKWVKVTFPLTLKKKTQSIDANEVEFMIRVNRIKLRREIAWTYATGAFGLVILASMMFALILYQADASGAFDRNPVFKVSIFFVPMFWLLLLGLFLAKFYHNRYSLSFERMDNKVRILKSHRILLNSTIDIHDIRQPVYEINSEKLEVKYYNSDGELFDSELIGYISDK
ncbi:MAG: hypothetical protein ACXAC2_08470 [Candidatus Kariarchaeaceae archaeon]